MDAGEPKSQGCTERSCSRHTSVSYALNRLWKYLVEWGNARVQTFGDVVPVDDWWAHIDDALDFDTLAAGLDDPHLDTCAPLSELSAG